MTRPEEIKNAGLKVTSPRLKVLQLLEEHPHEHLTADDCYRLLAAMGEEIGIATIYRVLTQFEQAGLVLRHRFEGDRAVFELNRGSHHDHIVCMQCGHVEEFCDADIEAAQRRVAGQRGFVIREHSLCLYADCTRDPCPHRPA